jgi:hypothetical protein
VKEGDIFTQSFVVSGEIHKKLIELFSDENSLHTAAPLAVSLGFTDRVIHCKFPSIVETDLTKDMDDRIIDEIKKKHPLKKLLIPEEVAYEVLAILDSSQHLNGTNRIINASEDVI